MRRLSSALFASALAAGMATAAEPTPPSTQVPDPPASAPVIFAEAPASRLYGSAEYLLWWVKDASLPVPLLVTGPMSEEDKGVNSLATILYGGSPQGFPPFSGARIALGAWLNDERTLGVEGRGFLLERRVAGYTAHSDANGNPLLQVPFFSTQPAGESAPTPSENGFPLAFSNGLAGGISINNSLRLWGSDVAGVFGLVRSCSWELSGLVGFSYVDLYESFDLTADLSGVAAPFRNQSGVTSDHFQTRNQFYGGLLGARAGYSSGPWSIDATGSVALGASHEVLNVTGHFTAVNYKNSSGPEGIFAQPSNSGRHGASDFAAVPEVQLKIGYRPTAWMRITLGYDFIYYSSVVRPGDQINRNLPKGQTFLQGDVVSATEPVPLFNTTSFFAHGINVGVEINY
jgi:hypothetical protein